MEDHELSDEIRSHIEILNHYFSMAAAENNLKVDIELNEYGTVGLKEMTQRIVCKVYKEVL